MSLLSALDARLFKQSFCTEWRGQLPPLAFARSRTAAAIFRRKAAGCLGESGSRVGSKGLAADQDVARAMTVVKRKRGGKSYRSDRCFEPLSTMRLSRPSLRCRRLGYSAVVTGWTTPSAASSRDGPLRKSNTRSA